MITRFYDTQITSSKENVEKEMTNLKKETNEKLKDSQQKMHIISSKNANLIQTLQVLTILKLEVVDSRD